MPKFQKLHIYSISTSWVNLRFFSLYEPQFPRYRPIFKIATWPLTTDPEVAHIHYFYPRGSKLGLCSLYRQRFPRYGPIFKLAIFGHETGQLEKNFQKLHILAFYIWGWGSKLSLFSLYGQRFLRHGPICKIPIYLCMKLGHWPKFQNLHIYSLSTPRGSKLSLFSLYGQRFPRHGAIFKIPKLPKLPPSPKFHSVLLYVWPFPRYWQFCIFPLATMLNFNLLKKKQTKKFQNSYN